MNTADTSLQVFELSSTSYGYTDVDWPAALSCG
jgi:hypothetical protein